MTRGLKTNRLEGSSSPISEVLSVKAESLKEDKNMEYKMGDKYNFPTSTGYETYFEGYINKITDKAVEFVSKPTRCVNGGHSACNVKEVCWLPKSIIEKNYKNYDEYWGIHYIIPPLWMDIIPRKKHEFHLIKEDK